MHSMPTVRSKFEIRTGSVADIDALCAIDVDAATLFTQAGLELNFPDQEHEFAQAERSRWLRSLAAGQTLLAAGAHGAPLGFAASSVLDDEPYLDQLSVATRCMRLGIGGSLLRASERAAQRAGARALWLTTYAHLPWNRPFYERAGFVVVPEGRCGPVILQEIAYQRHWLPCPEHRVVMRKSFGTRSV
jgi:ribosomal protein S18 acetylase RimI-like enzyme